LLATPDGCVGARPLAAKRWRLAECRKALNGWTEQQGLDQFKLGITFAGQTVSVDQLPKLDQLVKLLCGRSF
jgi:hypothetical protein